MQALSSRFIRRCAGMAAFILILGGAPKAHGEETVLTHPREVTVFPDSARVTREGALLLSAGSHQVVFPDLPASVIESSLRLTVEGPEGTKLYGVSLRKDYRPEIAEKRTRQLKARLQGLQDQAADLDDRMEVRKNEIELLKGLAKESGKIAASHMGAIPDFTHSADSVEGRIGTLLASNRKDERRERGLKLEIDALNRKLSEGGSTEREKQTAEADIELPQEGTASFTLTYQVSDASWTPMYDLRLSTEGVKPQMDLAFNAQVRQKTGEDWKGVILTLSTSRPNEGTQVPDPTDWWLDFITEQAKTITRSFGMANYAMPQAAMARLGAVDLYAKKNIDKEEDAPPAPAEVVTAQTLQAPYAMSFAIPLHRDIPSDGTDHRVGVAQDSQPVDLKLVAVPRLSQAAYLEAHITYSGEQALLPGAAQLFRDGDFVGTADLEAKSPGEAFDLGFGQDDAVRVERKMVDETTGKGGFLSGNGERQYHWVTTLTNYHQGLRTVEVREQLPRSREKEITVEATQIAPKPQLEDPEKPGLVCWELHLKPKEKTKLTFAYKVDFPEKDQVTGLE